MMKQAVINKQLFLHLSCAMYLGDAHGKRIWLTVNDMSSKEELQLGPMINS